MFPQSNDLWIHFRSSGGELKTETVSCLHCGVSLQAKPVCMKDHLINCKAYQIIAKERIENSDSRHYQTAENDQKTVLQMGIIGDGTNTSFLKTHIGYAELLGKMCLVSGCLTYVNSQRSQFANMYSIPYSRCYASYSDFCEKETKKHLNVIILTSSLNSHYDMALEAIERGFHIMCESPLCMTENEALTLCKAASVKGIVFHITNPFCYDPMILLLRDILQHYLLGEITHIHITYLQNNRMNETDLYDPMVVGVSDCTAHLGIPAYEILRFVYPKPVYRLMACLASESPSGMFDEHGYITMELEGGVMASMVLSKVATLYENEMRIEVEGTLGSIEWSSQRKSLECSFIDGTHELIDLSCSHFHGIDTHFGERLSPPISSMYNDFYNHVCAVLKGQPYDPIGVTVKEAMESIYFLSMCVTSNLQMSSWVELRIPDVFDDYSVF